MGDFPCSTCKSECCGPVPLSRHRLGLIEKHLANLPAEEYATLAAQKRGRLDCAFVDTRTYTCAVYPVRPNLCKLYGKVDDPKMRCPHVNNYSLVQLVPTKTADTMIEMDGDPVMLSDQFNYRQP